MFTKKLIHYSILIIFMQTMLFSKPWKQLGNIIEEPASSNAGASIAVNSDGTILAISEPAANKVKIFKFFKNKWVLITEISSDATSVALNSNGDIIVLGEPEWPNGNQNGRVRIFQNIEDIWIEIPSSITGQNAGDQAGSSIAITYDQSDNLFIAEGEPTYDIMNLTGRVRIFKYDGNIITQVQEFDGISPTQQFFGSSTSMTCDSNNNIIVAIGTQEIIEPNKYHRANYVYIYKNNIWSQYGNTIYGNQIQTQLDQFGGVVQLDNSGTKIVVGDISIPTINGSIELYEYNEQTQTWKLNKNSSIINQPNIGNVAAIDASGTYIAFQEQNPQSFITKVIPIHDSLLLSPLLSQLTIHTTSLQNPFFGKTSLVINNSNNILKAYIGSSFFNKIFAVQLNPDVLTLQYHPHEPTDPSKPINSGNSKTSPDLISQPTIPTKNITTPGYYN